MRVGRRRRFGVTLAFTRYYVTTPRDEKELRASNASSETTSRVSTLASSFRHERVDARFSSRALKPSRRRHPRVPRRRRYFMYFCTPGLCLDFAHPYFIAFAAACFKYASFVTASYFSAPSQPLVNTTVSCSLPTLKPSWRDAARAGLSYCGNPYCARRQSSLERVAFGWFRTLKVTLDSAPLANSARSSRAAIGDLTRHAIWSFVLRRFPNAWGTTERRAVGGGETRASGRAMARRAVRSASTRGRTSLHRSMARNARIILHIALDTFR